MTATTLGTALWPPARLGDAMTQLARASRLPMRDVPIGEVSPGMVSDRVALSAWVVATAPSLRLAADPLRVTARGIGRTLHESSPALIAVGRGEQARYAALVAVHGDVASLLAPDGRRTRIAMGDLARSVRADLDPGTAAQVDALFDQAAIPQERRERARAVMVDEALGPRVFDVGWSLAVPPGAPFGAQLGEGGVISSAGVMLVAQLAAQAMAIAGFWLIGRGALEGELSVGWLAAWALTLLSVVPLRALGTWAQGNAALRFAVLLKRRLLEGALRLHPEEVRTEGSGAMLGRVIESQALESLVTGGGLTALLALVEVATALVVMGLGPGGIPAAGAFCAMLIVTVLLARRIGRHMETWTRARLQMTRDLVERMIGHRTRLAQEPRERWHLDEDDQLARYATLSASLDGGTAWLRGALPRAWLLVGLVAMTPGFLRSAEGGTELAWAVGGLILGYRALAHVTLGVSSLLRARVAWDKTRPLFEAGAREERAGSPSWGATGPVTRGHATLEARDLQFRYPTRHEAVLRGATLRVGAQDRILLEGASGGGKSTLGAILTGLRVPDAGLLLLGGLDPQTLGEGGWRRRIVAAPQFHENHVLSATLAFNLLMGRTWPADPKDLEEAEVICRELGLGSLLDRMPSGIMQMVGDTGWQLSHGERSRLFIARTLLQRADVVVMDESFAALDPETLQTALRCVLARAPALIVIAHP